jgi:flavodoxin
MRKAFKIVLIIFAILVMIFVVFGAIFFLDLAAFTATGSETKAPSGPSIGTALVIYDPGLSGASKDLAFKIATRLQAVGYTTTFAGIKSSAASSPSGYNVVVVGGPIYAGTPTTSVKEFLSNLNPTSTLKVGVFGSGQGESSPEDVAQITNAIASLPSRSSLSNVLIVKIGQSENLDARATDFVNQLVS